MSRRDSQYPAVSPTDHRSSAFEVVLSEDDARLLNLSATGLSEAEIGAIVYLSPHTVHHRLERLRYMVGARNRIQLAAWAALHGYYRPQDLDDRSHPDAHAGGEAGEDQGRSEQTPK